MGGIEIYFSIIRHSQMTNVFIHHIDFKTCGMTTSSMLLFKRKALLLTHHSYEETDQLTFSYEETLTITYLPVS